MPVVEVDGGMQPIHAVSDFDPTGGLWRRGSTIASPQYLTVTAVDEDGPPWAA